MSDRSIAYRISQPVDNTALNDLFASTWKGHAKRNFEPVLLHSLLYICAYEKDTLVGFVNLAWDGGVHAFLLDTTVHKQWQHRGIGRQLVLRAVEMANRRGIKWIHVDYEPHLDYFYKSCGFLPTFAGLIHLPDR